MAEAKVAAAAASQEEEEHANVNTANVIDVDKDQIAVLREQFHVFDLNGNGYIEVDELRHGLRLLGYQISDEGLEHLWKLVGVEKTADAIAGAEQRRMSFEQFIAWNRELFLYDVKETFQTIDTDRSGWISRAELTAYYAKQGYDYTADEIDDFLYATDFNGDGRMQLDEFIAGMAAADDTGNAFFVLNGEMYLAKLQHEFGVMDANGDGYVTRQELKQGSTLSDVEIDLTFRELDTDGDGRISLPEFIASAVAIKQESSTKRQRAVRRIKKKKRKPIRKKAGTSTTSGDGGATKTTTTTTRKSVAAKQPKKPQQQPQGSKQV